MRLVDFVPKRKMSLADAAKLTVGLLCGEAFMWVGFFLILLAGSFSTYIGAATFLCWVLLLVLIVRRELKLDIKALDSPNDNPRANRLIGKRRDDRD
jgi:membrane protein implicated in regulation of membrane protease activity